MKLSVLQPKIIRGDIDHNVETIQKLIMESKGNLLILPEYALTGSLVLESNVNIKDWVGKCKEAIESLVTPEGKTLIVNSLVEQEDRVFNCCKLIPSDDKQCKLFPDKSELDSGISAGSEQTVFTLYDRTFKVIICTDLRYIEKMSTEELDFILFIFHFTDTNYNKVMKDVKEISVKRKLPIIVSSLVSDQNIGFSSYVNCNTVVSLSDTEGILEIDV